MSRTVFVSLVLFILCAMAGCSLGVWQDDGSNAIIPAGDEAAGVARSRAHVYLNTIDKLRALRDAANAQRLGLLQQATDYRNRAATVLTDATYSDLDRRAYARQYAAFASQIEREAAEYAKRADVYTSRMALLENKRQRRLQNAQGYDRVRVTLSQ